MLVELFCVLKSLGCRFHALKFRDWINTLDIFTIFSAGSFGMPAALTDLKGGSPKLEASLKCLGKAFKSSQATLIPSWSSGLVTMTTGNSGVSSMTPGNMGVSSLVAEELDMAFITAGGSGVAAIL